MNKHCRLRNRIKQILCGKKGFTFTELLVATLIMLLATGVLTSTMVLAIRHFFESTQRTEAQFLCASLAEFVEDELSFARVDASGETWSKGTHNMGSDIRFLVNTGTADAPSYQPIDGTTLGTYGRLVITGENNKDDLGNLKYFKIVSDGTYEVERNRGYDLDASMSLKWDSTNEWFEVKIKVVDKKDHSKVLSEADFTVRPAVKTS